MKPDLILIAAHQLKTPLSGLRWTFKMFLGGEVGKLTPEQKKLLEKGNEATEGMIILINDLLNMARLEKGKSIYNFQKHNFSLIAKNAAVSLLAAAKRKNIKIEMKFIPKEIWLVCDNATIKIAISNLVENAINYSSERKKVFISAAKKGNYVEFCVEDSGIGIPSYQRKNIFSKFFRGDNAARLQIGGSGLGLHITKKIIKDHGGKIRFESQENKGSKFFFSLPLAKN